MVSRKACKAGTQKPCARLRDADRIANQRPAILPWSRCALWLSSFRLLRAQAIKAFYPRDGHLPVNAQSPECCWASFCFEHELFDKNVLKSCPMRATRGSASGVRTVCLKKQRKNARGRRE